jgi:diguanylate cyclase (GGDEF)-like protein
MATSDKLTGLLNRQAFDLLFEQALKDAERSKTSLCMILIDLDHFKGINDDYGHVAGDSVLKAIAETLGEPLRKGDPICRWGGEEFLILLRDCRLEDAIRLAEKLRETVRDMSPLPDHPDAHVTISAGVGLHKAGETATQFATRIDSALYAAKNAGRDRVEIAKEA